MIPRLNYYLSLTKNFVQVQPECRRLTNYNVLNNQIQQDFPNSYQIVIKQLGTPGD
jgi:hypothetical protein